MICDISNNKTLSPSFSVWPGKIAQTCILRALGAILTNNSYGGTLHLALGFLFSILFLEAALLRHTGHLPSYTGHMALHFHS